jgi:hypothetical protein
MSIRVNLATDKSNFKNDTYKARLLNDVGVLYCQTSSTVIIRPNPTTLGNVVEFEHNSNHYRIELPRDYPFGIPKHIHINQRNYEGIKQMPSDRFKNILDTIYKKKCLCCSSSVCAANWTPALTLAHLVNEIEENLYLIQKIRLRVLCETIRLKYNCRYDFAMFEKYLIQDDYFAH